MVCRQIYKQQPAHVRRLQRHAAPLPSTALAAHAFVAPHFSESDARPSSPSLSASSSASSCYPASSTCSASVLTPASSLVDVDEHGNLKADFPATLITRTPVRSGRSNSSVSSTTSSSCSESDSSYRRSSSSRSAPRSPSPHPATTPLNHEHAMRRGIDPGASRNTPMAVALAATAALASLGAGFGTLAGNKESASEREHAGGWMALPVSERTTETTNADTGSALEREAETNAWKGKRRSKTELRVTAAPGVYVPPPRGTFRSSYARVLRSEMPCWYACAGAVEGAQAIMESKSKAASPSLALQIQAPSSSSSSSASASTTSLPPAQIEYAHAYATVPPAVSSTSDQVVPVRPSDLAQLPDPVVLSVAEFDFFCASRARAAMDRTTSPVWGRSPAAPPPPRIRRWLRGAQEDTAPVGWIEGVECTH